MASEDLIIKIIESSIDKGTRLSDSVNVVIPSFHRDHYIGMSSIGGCPRALFYGYNKIEEFEGVKAIEDDEPHSPNLLRIFRTGHVIEREIIHWMTLGGLKVTDTQTRYSDFNGKFCGHNDGIIHIPSITPIVFDVKSMNDASFKKFCESDSIKSYNIFYYSQLLMYMRYSNLKDFAAIIGYNKNNSMIKVKLMRYDEVESNKYYIKAAVVSNAKSPRQISVDRSTQNCDYCGFKPICDYIDA